jgi:16S rRNA (guanine(527)-N(7))-methyltransferase RsmG
LTGRRREELVPRGTEDLLSGYVELAKSWNKKINLLSRRGDAEEIWERHILDSAQLTWLAPATARTWLDLGTGAGFPGMVCAVIAKAMGRATSFTLVEADGRKVAFLREAARRQHVDARVLHSRIEQLCLPPQDVISARALAPLDRLLGYAAPFCHAGTVLLFPKGRQANCELTLARGCWHIRAIRIPSRTDPEATILKLSEVSRRR